MMCPRETSHEPRNIAFLCCALPCVAARVPFAAASVGGHAMACPMRVWLLVISGVVAAYLAWTSSLFSGASLDEGCDDEPASNGSRAGEGRERKRGANKMSWRDWGWFAIDGLSGKYLYSVAVNGDGKAGTRRSARKTTARPRRD